MNQHPDSIHWTCHKCGALIKDGAGHLALAYRDLHPYQAQTLEDTRRDALQTMIHGPWTPTPMDLAPSTDQDRLDPAPWRALHYVCEEVSGVYSIPVERARTAVQLLDWSAHLASKGWMSDTNWPDVLEGVCRSLGVDA